MDDVLTLNESELSAISELALGNKPSAEATAGPIAALVGRGLATVDDGAVSFGEELRAAFQPMATCKINLIVMNDGGNPQDQFFIGEEESSAHVMPQEHGLNVRRLEPSALPAAVAASLSALLASPSTAELPNGQNFAAVGSALGMEGLKPIAWGGLVIARPGAAGSPDAANEWVMVVRCESGFVWQYQERAVLAFAENEAELATLLAELVLLG